jgi:hypothetical protein
LTWPGSYSRREIARQLLSSGLFNFEFHRGQWPGPASPLDAAGRYAEEGCIRGLRPNSYFDTHWYLDRYEDVRRSGLNPLPRYYEHGFREGRDPGPKFQTKYYLDSNSDVRAQGATRRRIFLGTARGMGGSPRGPPEPSRFRP